MRFNLFHFVFLLAPSIASAQGMVGIERSSSTRGPDNQVSIHPFSPLGGAITFDYERKLSQNVSVLLTPSAIVPVNLLRDTGSAGGWKGRLHGGALEAGMRFYALGNGIQGLFLQPTLVGGYLSGSFNDNDGHSEKGSATFIGASAQVGWQWLIAQRAVIRLSGGGSYRHAFANYQDSASRREKIVFGGIRPAANFSVGAAF